MILLVFCKKFVPIIVREINEALNLRLTNSLRPYLVSVEIYRFRREQSCKIFADLLLISPPLTEVADADGFYGITKELR